VTFRQRLTVASAAAVAVAVVTASVVTWFVVRRELRAQVDNSLLARLPFLERIADPSEPIQPGLGIEPGGPSFVFEVVTPNGEVIRPADEPSLGIAVGGDFGNQPTLRDINANGVHYRLLFAPIRQGFTVLLARPLSEVDDTLRRLVVLMVLITGGGVALAVGLGMAVTRTAAAPVARLSDAAERVTETGDLSLRIEGAETQDEIGRLAERFNAMMGALESSVTAQRQLVADASHELRTPLTSVRANIDLLASGRLTDSAERERLIADVRVQLEELTAIVNDVVELARGAEQPIEFEDVRLDEVVQADVDRFERRPSHPPVEVDAEPSIVTGDAARISRAVRNMLDNAATWGPPDGAIEVTVRDATVSVRDHGPGFADEDLPHIFDRFYRSTSARGMPGSGLGLAIVRQVAEAHGGRAVAENAPGGGAVVRLELLPNSQDSLTKGSSAGD
jgi:two-component system, OmpR family, sensor histidine kinase MprB